MKERFAVGSRMLFSAMVAVVLAGGCESLAPRTFSAQGIPSDKYLVGGGWSMNFTAPERGTVYVAEMSSHKLLETKSVDEGEMFSQTIDPGQSDLRDVGIDPKLAQFRLYFVPATRGPKDCEKEDKD